MATSKIFTDKWHVNRSAVRLPFKKPPPGPWDGYFYDGPSLNFGHVTKTKGKKG